MLAINNRSRFVKCIRQLHVLVGAETVRHLAYLHLLLISCLVVLPLHHQERSQLVLIHMFSGFEVFKVKLFLAASRDSARRFVCCASITRCRDKKEGWYLQGLWKYVYEGWLLYGSTWSLHGVSACLVNLKGTRFYAWLLFLAGPLRWMEAMLSTFAIAQLPTLSWMIWIRHFEMFRLHYNLIRDMPEHTVEWGKVDLLL